MKNSALFSLNLRPRSGDALMLIDVQNDFLPGGSLATEYCVLYTVRDALSRGFEVHLLLDGIRAINLKPGDGQRAIDEMTSLGAYPLHFEDIAA